MATGRSFAEYVKDKCYNGLYQAAEDYFNENWESMNLYSGVRMSLTFLECLRCFKFKKTVK